MQVATDAEPIKIDAGCSLSALRKELMIRTVLRFVLVLMIAGGVPYAWFSDTVSQGLQNTVGKLVPKKSGASFAAMLPGNDSRSLAPAALPSNQPPPQPASVAGEVGVLPQIAAGPLVDDPLATVLRMDITHDWIIATWPRVSTIRSQQNLLGFRVPFVSGTRLDDVSGSLTYYFDRLGRVQRINLDGNTGDYRRLQRVATQLFRLRSEPNLRAGLFVTRWNAKPTNVLWITHAPVVRADQPHWKYEVKLEINRPALRYSLSEEFVELLGQG